jgi:hypothetical protein
MIMETEAGRRAKGPEILKYHRTTQYLQTVALWYEEYAGNNQINYCFRARGYKLTLYTQLSIIRGRINRFAA